MELVKILGTILRRTTSVRYDKTNRVSTMKDAIEYTIRGIAVAAILTAGGINKMREYREPIKTEAVSIDELLMDWHMRATWGDQETKIEYLNKLRALNEELEQFPQNWQVQAYKTGDRYHYSIKIERQE